MKSTDFLKKLSKFEKIMMSDCALNNLIESIRLSYNETEYFEMIHEFTTDLSKYLNNLSLILRDLGIKCQGLQCMTTFDYNNEEFLIEISNRVGSQYGDVIKTHYFTTHEYFKKIDLASF